MQITLKEVYTNGLPDKILNIDAISTPIYEKFALLSERTISGRTLEKWPEDFVSYEIEITYIDQDGYDTLVSMWKSVNDIIFISEIGNEMIMHFEGSTMRLDRQYDKDGKPFYTGIINLKE